MDHTGDRHKGTAKMKPWNKYSHHGHTYDGAGIILMTKEAKLVLEALEDLSTNGRTEESKALLKSLSLRIEAFLEALK